MLKHVHEWNKQWDERGKEGRALRHEGGDRWQGWETNWGGGQTVERVLCRVGHGIGRRSLSQGRQSLPAPGKGIVGVWLESLWQLRPNSLLVFSCLSLVQTTSSWKLPPKWMDFIGPKPYKFTWEVGKTTYWSICYFLKAILRQIHFLQFLLHFNAYVHQKIKGVAF